jgi:hypothetical protein
MGAVRIVSVLALLSGIALMGACEKKAPQAKPRGVDWGLDAPAMAPLPAIDQEAARNVAILTASAKPTEEATETPAALPAEQPAEKAPSPAPVESAAPAGSSKPTAEPNKP